jgi:hypothetical protein
MCSCIGNLIDFHDFSLSSPSCLHLHVLTIYACNIEGSRLSMIFVFSLFLLHVPSADSAGSCDDEKYTRH